MPGSPGTLLERLCAGARELFIAAPYVKVDALTRLMDLLASGASLTCITRWNVDDMASGASDLACRALVLEYGGAFRLHPTLHAKYYRIDDEVLVGSANLTNSAMGWSRKPNLEILCRPGQNFGASTFQQRLLEDTREVGDHEFSVWQACVAFSLKSESRSSFPRPSLDDWRPATREPRHLELAYQGRYGQIASMDEQRAAIRDLELLRIPPGLTR